MKESPIGIFDSGIGGLTVAYAVKNRLPNENLVYFGDTAHLPYGDKSQAAIQAYSVKICDFLLKKNCKLILIACNSASAAAYDLVKEYVGKKSLVLNVIDPVVGYIDEHFTNHKVGLIGTKQTVFSNVYQTKLNQLNSGINLQSLATPLLVPMIEEGFFENNISESIINKYLKDSKLSNIDALILGCTHYPLIKKEIEAFYSGKVAVIDSSMIVAEKLAQILESSNLLNPKKILPEKRFFVSDYTKSFEQSTKIFFEEALSLEHMPIT